VNCYLEVCLYDCFQPATSNSYTSLTHSQYHFFKHNTSSKLQHHSLHIQINQLNFLTTSTSNQTKMPVCFICGVGFQDDWALIRHFREVHKTGGGHPYNRNKSLSKDCMDERCEMMREADKIDSVGFYRHDG
jgi:hypothetical protein